MLADRAAPALFALRSNPVVLADSANTTGLDRSAKSAGAALSASTIGVDRPAKSEEGLYKMFKDDQSLA
jgi:hypothetical protein